MVMVRKDICPHRDAALNIGELASKVLIHALDLPARRGSDQSLTVAYPRETIQQVRAYNAQVLDALGKVPTLPETSQDWTRLGQTGWAGVAGLGVPSAEGPRWSATFTVVPHGSGPGVIPPFKSRRETISKLPRNYFQKVQKLL